MSETLSATPAPRRASLVTILAIFFLFALFLGLIRYVYMPRQTGVFTDDGIHNAELRKKNLATLRAKEAAQAASYGWVDQKAGVVQLPIDRAMELTLQRFAKQQ
jgi:hypothetical protein